MVADRQITGMRVLVVDDNRPGADALSALIELELGCRVSIAYDGEQALASALSTRPDVMILDLHMPGLSGIDVASRAMRGFAGPTKPLMLAMTGRADMVHDLADIDLRFDRAFAKPIDIATLVATLRWYWNGSIQSRPPVQYKFFETFTQAAREVAPFLKTRQQELLFDAEGVELTLEGDEPSMHSALYRLMCGAVDLMGPGLVMFDARTAVSCDGHKLTVNVAGSGMLESPERTAEVLDWMGLRADDSVSPQERQAGVLRASGNCPNTGGAVSFSSQPSEGILLRLEMSAHAIDLEPPSQADGVRAWIVDGREVAPAVLERRLQRLGWRVWRFASLSAAAKRVNACTSEEMPELLILRDDSHGSPSALMGLRDRLPTRTHCLLLVESGSTVLRDAHPMPRCNVRVEPLSPSDLAEATVLKIYGDGAAAETCTLSHTMHARRKVLVVDDHEVNRIVASGLLRALGYEVATAADGLDAIEYCKQSPPDAVFMDVNMPVLGGIDASRRLSELQRRGRVPPFPIVTATADDAPETRSRCFEAGVSGYLCKPLRLETMRDELRRVGVPASFGAKD